MAYTSRVFYTRYAGGGKKYPPRRADACLLASLGETDSPDTGEVARSVRGGAVARRAGGSEPCRDPKYFGLPGGSLHPLRREPPRRGGQATFYTPNVWRSISRRSFSSFSGLVKRPRPLTSSVHSTLVASPPPSSSAVKVPLILPFWKLQLRHRGFSLRVKTI